MINSTLLVQTLFFVPIENLAKAQICIDNFGILIVVSKKIIKLDTKDTIIKADLDDLYIKSIISSFDTNISIKKPKKNQKNAKAKLIKKKFICKLSTWSHCQKYINIDIIPIL